MSTLNIDNIADVAGTGAPDFAAMPSVAGDPVVESGSNSDGEWTRWADGTQVTRSNKTGLPLTQTAYGSLYSGTITVVLPLAFIAPPVVSTGRSAWQTGAPWSTHQVEPTTTEVLLRVYDIVQRTGSQLEVSYTAIGRWK